MTATPLPVVVLISGRGTNLQSIIDATHDGRLAIDIRAVISNNPGAAGLERARAAGLHTEIIDHRDFPDRPGFEAALMQAIDRRRPGLVVLAGFMRILGEPFIAHYLGRLINIHPSLLPAFKGLNTHARVLAAGAREHGATVHFVTADVDGGPIIARAVVAVRPGDSTEQLAARVLEQEHQLLPDAIRWFAEGRLRLNGAQAMLDDVACPVAPRQAYTA